MDLDEIEQHWKGWAEKYKLQLRATTKTGTIKELEVLALYRAFKKTPFFSQKGCEVLEVGCGNGHNCFRLLDMIPGFTFTGVDYIPEMISNANKIKASCPEFDTINFFVGNVLNLDENTNLKERYNIIYTVRCLINLNTHELQLDALEQLYRKTAHGGYIVLIENIAKTYSKQNQLREFVGLEKRTPAEFNHFIDEAKFLSYAEQKLNLVYVEDFTSFHDIILYVLLPMINGGKVDYEHPIILAATKLLLANPEELSNSFGDFGQNRLYVFKKE